MARPGPVRPNRPSERGPALAALGALLGLGLLVVATVLGRRRERAPTEAPAGRATPGYEQRDLSVPLVFAFAATLLVVLAVALVLVSWLQASVTGAPVRIAPEPLTRVAPPEATPPPEPQLQVEPGEQYRSVRAAQERLLRSYGWVDRERGIARIPIERAMELIAARGLPARTGAEPEPEPPPDSSSGRFVEGGAP